MPLWLRKQALFLFGERLSVRFGYPAITDAPDRRVGIIIATLLVGLIGLVAPIGVMALLRRAVTIAAAKAEELDDDDRGLTIVLGRGRRLRRFCRSASGL